MLFFLYDFKNSIVIARNAAEIHRNNRLCLIRNCLFKRVIIHFKTIYLRIDEFQCCADVANNGSRSRVGICGNDYFIARPDAENM